MDKEKLEKIAEKLKEYGYRKNIDIHNFVRLILNNIIHN